MGFLVIPKPPKVGGKVNFNVGTTEIKPVTLSAIRVFYGLGWFNDPPGCRIVSHSQLSA